MKPLWLDDDFLPEGIFSDSCSCSLPVSSVESVYSQMKIGMGSRTYLAVFLLSLLALTYRLFAFGTEAVLFDVRMMIRLG